MIEKTGGLFMLIVLSAAFLLVSLLVFLSYRNKKFVSWKLKLGALLITFTSVSANCQEPVITCYEVYVPNPVTIDEKYYSEGQVTVRLSESDVITGRITTGRDERITYKITSGSQDLIIQSGVISSGEGNFDPVKSVFTIKLNDRIKNDKSSGLNILRLNIYKTEKNQTEESKHPVSVFEIIIKR